MGLSSKLVSSDGLEFEYCSSSRAPSLEQVVGADQRLIPGAVKRQPLLDRTTDQSEPVKCPRCESTNTKFCYFNNYNKSQPRHFCKTCRRHWTRGGTLRNVPVGGSRKNKRLKTASTATSASATAAAATITTPVVDDHMSARSNISNGILSPPHRDTLNSVQFLASSLPMSWQAGIGQEAAAAASSWSWEDIESLVSTDHGLAWDESKLPLP